MIKKEDMPAVAELIRKLRYEQRTQRESFASALLLNDEQMAKIEAGEIIPDDHVVTLMANIFGVRKEALERGVMAAIGHNWTAESSLWDLEKSIRQMRDKTHRLLEEVQNLRGMEHFRTEPLMEDDVFYVIRDNETGEYLRAETGVIYQFTDMDMALDTVTMWFFF